MVRGEIWSRRLIPSIPRERRFFGAAVFVDTEKAPTEAGACGYFVPPALAMVLVNSNSRFRALTLLIR